MRAVFDSTVLGAAPSSPAVKCLNPSNIAVMLYCCMQLCVCCVVSVALLLTGLVGAVRRWGWFLLKSLDCGVVCNKRKGESRHHRYACGIAFDTVKLSCTVMHHGVCCLGLTDTSGLVLYFTTVYEILQISVYHFRIQ